MKIVRPILLGSRQELSSQISGLCFISTTFVYVVVGLIRCLPFGLRLEPIECGGELHHATRRERVGAVGAGAGALDFVVVKGPPAAVEHSGLGPRGREAVRGVPAARVGVGCGRVWGQLGG